MTTTHRTGADGSPEPVVGAILLRDDRVLLGYRHPAREHFPACWDVPGGHIEAGETAHGALRRELLEEIGVDVEVGERDADFRIRAAHYDLELWVVRSWQGEVTNRDPQEHAELGWFKDEELGSLPLADAQYLDFLTAALKSERPQAQP